MSAVRAQKYHHRKNRDGSYDAICSGCFLTIAQAQTEKDLVVLERQHTCDSSLLAERGILFNESVLREAS